MRFASVPIPRVLAACGAAYVLAILVLVVTQTLLGSRLFYATSAVMVVAYVITIARVWHEPRAPRRLLFAAFALALAFRIPPAVAPVDFDSDMVRYIWDGRVQRLGYNPYTILPSDPALAYTHSDRSEQMPSRNARTPYPPAAQLFFRLVVSLNDSRLAMKLAFVLCDLLTMIVLWRWLVATGRSEWLTLTYAWNPLVVLEIAHSGHVDALGALWIAASAFWLTRRRTMLAALAFVLAIATKLLPIVLVPLFVGRIRKRDAFVGALSLAALYLSFSSGGHIQLGDVPNVVDYIRFNGPVFATIRAISSPRVAAAVALMLGLGIAVWMRLRRPVSDPAAWAWPMAVALVCAPVIYPWYLLYLTPFLFTVATIPLNVWTMSIIVVYEVWFLSRNGGRWRAPLWVTVVEFIPVIVAAMIVVRRTQRTQPAEEQT
jgi:alpha-1,6-mannosyltransferase